MAGQRKVTTDKTTGLCLGPALRVCATLGNMSGAKVLSFISSRAGVGEGAVKPKREVEAFVRLKEAKQHLQVYFFYLND